MPGALSVWLALAPVALGRWVAKLTKTVALQSWVWDDDRWRWQNRRFIWGRVSVSSVRQMHWRKGSVQARFDFLIGVLGVSFWSSCCELFHANGDHADFSLGFFLPLGAILDNAKLILRVQWFVLFGQELLVQVVHLDAMYFAFWILAREPEVDSMLPYQKQKRALQASQDISHFVPGKQALGHLHELFACDGSAGIVCWFVSLIQVIGCIRSEAISGELCIIVTT